MKLNAGRRKYPIQYAEWVLRESHSVHKKNLETETKIYFDECAHRSYFVGPTSTPGSASNMNYQGESSGQESEGSAEPLRDKNNELIDIKNSPMVQKAKMAAELERQIFLQACLQEFRSASPADRRFLDSQASQIANTVYEKELIEAIKQMESDKEQIKDLIRAVQEEAQEILGELNRLQQ